MLEFSTLEDVLDFAILQEKAAQAFYKKISGEVRDDDVRRFYLSLADQEVEHERTLRRMKQSPYRLTEPGLRALRDSGYLKAMPIDPDITFRQAVKYAWDKERSARLLYTLMANTIEDENMADLFRQMAVQEEDHAEHFRKEYAALTPAE